MWYVTPPRRTQATLTLGANVHSTLLHIVAVVGTMRATCRAEPGGGSDCMWSDTSLAAASRCGLKVTPSSSRASRFSSRADSADVRCSGVGVSRSKTFEPPI